MTIQCPVLPGMHVLCGICGTDLRHEDEKLACENCLIAYDPTDLMAPPEFLDEHAAACGDPDHPTSWNQLKPFLVVAGGVVKIWRTWHYAYGPCALPAGHHREHHYPKTTTHTDRKVDDA